MQYTVETNQLTRRFGDFVAVDGVTFQVESGEVFGFLGPNGSGKTTTIRMLCGLITPTSGEGRVLGLDIGRDAERIRTRIGYMSQKFSLYTDLSVVENLAFYAGVYGTPRTERAARLAEMVALAGLRGRERDLVSSLSGGWRQRLALACAIIHRPQVLFLDEPTGGVDPEARRTFWELIYELAAGGVTVFVTTHFMDEAEHCNRIGMMYGGRLIALDAPDTLKRATLGGEVIEVEGYPQEQARSVVARLPGVASVATYGARLHAIVDDADARVPEVEHALAAAGIGEVHAEPIAPSLEDVFVTLIERQARVTSPRPVPQATP